MAKCGVRPNIEGQLLKWLLETIASGTTTTSHEARDEGTSSHESAATSCDTLHSACVFMVIRL